MELVSNDDLVERIERYQRKQQQQQQHPVTNSITGNFAALEVYSRLVDNLRRHSDAAAIFGQMIHLEPGPILQRDLRHMTDRVIWAKEALGFHPESPLQFAALFSQARNLILNCNRQWGKSTIAALRILHRAWFWPNSLILIVSRAHAQSGETLHKIKSFLPDLGILTPKGDGVNRLSIKLPNGSRIIALPGGEKPTRSYSSVALLVIDEAAMVPDPVQDAVIPTLARTNGDLMLISTPRGKRGSFYRTWVYGGTDWERIFGPATESPRISSQFLESQKARGEDFYAQEYLCEFIDRDSHLFNQDQVRAIFTQDFQSWQLPSR